MTGRAIAPIGPDTVHALARAIHGARSCDPTAAVRGTWFIDAATNRMARLRL